MAKQAGISVNGTIIKALPGTTFNVQLDNGAMVLGHLAGKMKMHFIKVLPGDKVTLELSPYDLTRGRIIRRELKGFQDHDKEDSGT
jgi:translation initiation factor IF-1